ncbi:hypothetical protein ACHAPC_004623 [Botrytis cinerea]
MSSLPKDGLVALTWSFTGVAVALTAGRYTIRWRGFHKFQIDDIIHGLACLVLIGYCITYTIAFPLNYKVEFFVAGLSNEVPTPAEMDSYFHFIIAVSATFWIINYLVKFSFLTFYRLIFGVSKKFMIAWWCVFGFTVVTFFINFISVFWACGKAEDLYVIAKCTSPSALKVTARVVTMWCVLNVISDLTIMALPLWMLKGLQMKTGQKIGLAVIFLIATIDVVFDILRTIYTVDGGAIALDTLWDILEPTITVMISALPSYRTLFGDRRKKSTSYKTLDHSGNTRRGDGFQDYELSTSHVSIIGDASKSNVTVDTKRLVG